jgi:hypothetical protein
MLSPSPIGYHAASERQVFLLTLDSLHAPWSMPIAEGRHFTCFCAMDARNVTAAELGEFCARLISLGCAYLCTWGPDCERVHDVMDELVVGDNPPQTYLGCLMTTWHAKDSLEDALHFFLYAADPDEEYAPNGCGLALCISVASTEWNVAIESI